MSECGYLWAMGPRHAVLSSVVLLTALGLAGCSSDPTSGASAVPSGPPQTEAPTSACGAMDAVLVEALAQTPEGQAFTSRPQDATVDQTRAAWGSFTQVLATDYLARLQAAAGDETTASSAVTALTTYNSASARLASGQVPEFQDEAQAEKDIKLGRTPTPNPEYTQDVEALTNAHLELSQCMPHWPVVF